MYNDPKCKPWTSRRWAPAGYASRYDLAEQTKAAQAHKPFAAEAGLEEQQIESSNGNGNESSEAGYEKNGLKNEKNNTQTGFGMNHREFGRPDNVDGNMAGDKPQGGVV